jgi:hypothetical protein
MKYLISARSTLLGPALQPAHQNSDLGLGSGAGEWTEHLYCKAAAAIEL